MLIFTAVFIKLGALSVWVHVLSVTLNAAMILIVALFLTVIAVIWKQKTPNNLKIPRNL
jgi:hypothetical protein